MKKLLVYGNRKCNNVYWDISTAKLEEKAFRALFKLLDTEWQVYVDLTEGPEKLEFPVNHPVGCMCEDCKSIRSIERDRERWYGQESDQREWYQLAKKGNYQAIKDLLKVRQDYEYEQWSIEAVE
jgi:hypothetical protein